MTSASRESTGELTVGPLTAEDLEPVVDIDRKVTGSARRAFFEKRLANALAEPKGFIYIAARSDDRLVGYALARLLVGEFGRDEKIVILDAMAVDPDLRHGGVGTALLEAVDEVARHKGVREMQTQARWTNSSLLRFFNAAGFEIAPRIVLSRPTDAPLDLPQVEDDDLEAEPTELDFSSPAADDFDALARDRVPVRSMAASDLDAIVTIDSRVTGGERRDYLHGKLTEALTESSVRVSLIAEIDGYPAGFIMARVDFGEFGRTAPSAVMDTLGVDPEQQHQGVGIALMSQLLVNLSSLRVETVRTEVDWNNFELLAYFSRIGFSPAQHIPLRRSV